jgi:hypothetical protein
MPRETPWRTEKGRRELTKEEAKSMLPEGASLMGAVIMLGADMDRERLLRYIDQFPCYASGPMATGMGHGLCINDKSDPLFVQTKPEKPIRMKKETDEPTEP